MGRKSLAKERRAEILEAFYRCLARGGLENASTRQIAKEAGVQPSILHHYFKDREEMIEELVKNVVDKIAVSYLEEIGRYKNPKTRFNKAVEFLFGPELINNEHSSFFYDCWAEAKRNNRIRGSFAMLYKLFREAIINLLIETNKAAGLSPGQVRELANIVIAIQDGVSLQWDMEPEEVDLKKMARLTKRLVELYIADTIKDGGK